MAAVETPPGVWADWPLILAYHGVSSQRRDGLALRVADFDHQMRWLADHGFQSLTLDAYLRRPVKKGERIVLITFDDGYEDNYSQAFPVLKRYGFTATIFLVSDYIGQEHVYWWDQAHVKSRFDARLYRPLNWRQIEEMVEYGIAFGSHTCTHPRALTALSHDKCWHEIYASRLALEHRLGAPVVSFCYPRGDLNDTVLGMVEQAGYQCGVVTPPRSGIPLTRYALRRVSMYRENSQLIFQLKTSTYFRRNYERLRRLRALLAV